MHTNKLILYRNMDNDTVLHDMDFLMEHCESSYYNKEDLQALFYDSVNKLLEICCSLGLEGNLWHVYLTYLLAADENAYSTACEYTGSVSGSICQVALHDFQIFKELFNFDFSILEQALDVECISILTHFQGSQKHNHIFHQQLRKRICILSENLAAAKTVKDFQQTITQFYQTCGVGKFGFHKAFRVDHQDDKVEIIPVTSIANVLLDDIIGYDIAKAKLIQNTEAFIHGKKANNCLLFGDAGTGKSSSIKAILNTYYDQGLRMIEVYKHQFQDLNEIISQIKNRNYKFIIYMDDLSFEEFETEYKYLKAVIEGGLEKKPDNILIYATSNRRHLIRETFRDKQEHDEELHINDTVQEKLSLVARFGVTIYFGSPDKKEFQMIVTELAHKNNINLSEEELFAEAAKWEMAHGGKSGRTAQQFIDYLAGL